MKTQASSPAKTITSLLIILAIIMITTMNSNTIENFIKGVGVVGCLTAFAAITFTNNTSRRA